MAATMAATTQAFGGLDLGQMGTDILLPARKRLSSIEAERIISVLELAIKKIDCCQFVLQLDDSETSTAACSDLSNDTQGCLEDFQGARAAFESAQSETEVMYEFENFTHITKNLLRALGKGPKPANPNSAGGEADTSISGMRQDIALLRDVLFQKLLTTVDEERRRNDYLANLVSQERRSMSDIAKLQGELDELNEARADEIGAREAQIERVTEELYSIVQHGQTVTSRIDADADKKIAAQKLLFDDELARLTAEVEGHAKNLGDIRASHAVHEDAGKKKKFKIESGTSRWIAKYDTEMGQKQAEIDDITQHYETEKKQLTELQERFVTVEKEYDVIMAAQKQERDRQETAAAKLAEQERAASTIQRSWAGYKEKKAAAKGSKKGKKGSGKGKKKSGKKKKKK